MKSSPGRQGPWLTGLALMFLSLSVAAEPAGDDEPVLIHWLVPDYPPAYIERGPRAGQGQGDQVLEWFRRALPEYRHSVRRESLARTMGILASAEGNFCVPGFPHFPGIREAMVAGNPIGVVPPLRVITLRDKVAGLPMRDGRVSLEAAMADTDLSLAVVAGRDYLDVDDLVRRHRDQANVLTVSPGDMVGSLFGMLLSGRVDYLVEHGFMLPYVRSLEPERGEQLVMLPMREARQTVTLYPLCRNNAWGREVVRALNDITATPDFRRMMVESFRAILPEEEKAEYQRLLDRAVASQD